MINLEQSVIDLLQKAARPLSLAEIYESNANFSDKAYLIQFLLELIADQMIESALVQGVRKYALPGIFSFVEESPSATIADVRTNQEASTTLTPAAASSLNSSDQIESLYQEIKTEKSQPAPTSIVFKILSYIEQHPGATYSDLRRDVHVKAEKNYILTYIKKGLVEVSNPGYKLVYLKLKTGFTADQVYATRQVGRTAKPKSAFVCPPYESQIAQPAELPQSAKLKTESIPNALPGILNVGFVNPTDYRKLKLAFTSDNTIIIFGLNIQPIELTLSESSFLIDFCTKINFCNSAPFLLK